MSLRNTAEGKITRGGSLSYTAEEKITRGVSLRYTAEGKISRGVPNGPFTTQNHFDSSTLKVFADNKKYVVKLHGFLSESLEKMWEKKKIGVLLKSLVTFSCLSVTVVPRIN